MSPRISDMDRLGFETAFAHAKQSYEEGGVPIGAALVHDGGDSDGATPSVVGQGHNMRVQKGSAILHGEIAALDDAGRQKPAVYRNATMVSPSESAFRNWGVLSLTTEGRRGKYTTLSPCSMCTGAILLYKIPRVIIGENTNFMGSEDLLREHGVEVVVLDDDRCKELMRRFIREKPEEWYEDIGETASNP